MSKELMSMYYLADFIRLKTGCKAVEVSWHMTSWEDDKEFKIILKIGSQTRKEFISLEDFKSYVKKNYLHGVITADALIQDGGFYVKRN